MLSLDIYRSDKLSDLLFLDSIKRWAYVLFLLLESWTLWLDHKSKIFYSLITQKYFTLTSHKYFTYILTPFIKKKTSHMCYKKDHENPSREVSIFFQLPITYLFYNFFLKYNCIFFSKGIYLSFSVSLNSSKEFFFYIKIKH